MKKITLIILAITTLSCSTEKHLKKAIEKNGIKESVSFIAEKYPEYYKRDSILIIDTVVRVDTIILKPIEMINYLNDSLDELTYYNDSLSIEVNKLTKQFKIVYKPKIRIVNDTIIVKEYAPPLICPDISKLNQEKPRNFTMLLLLIVESLAIIALIFIKK